MALKKAVKKGGVEYLSALMLVCLGGIMLLYSISVKEVKQVQINAEDSLDSACLAAALIDIDSYGSNNSIVIRDFNCAWGNFVNYLKSNMNLNNGLISSGNSIYDKIDIHGFYIYNIIDGKLITHSRTESSGYKKTEKIMDGSETTPDGTRIESATIYADIGMKLRGLFGFESYVHVRSSVDVVKN